MITKKHTNILNMILRYVLLSVALIIILLPVLYVFFGSFKTTQEILAGNGGLLPEKYRFENYVQAWKMADFKTYTWNSVYYAFFVVIANIITSTMSGYVFARGNFPGKKIVFGILTSTMFICMGTISIYPTLQIAKAMHINNSLWGVIIVRIFGINVSYMYITKGFVNSIPKELDESAKIDGCGFFQNYVRIIFPLLKPAVASIGILSFRSAWNDYLLPMVFTMANTKNATISVGLVALKGQSDAAASWNLILAGAMISIVPIVIVYLMFNRYFASGMTTGAVKG